MIKIAIFVEGLTETSFIKKLIAKRYGKSPYRMNERKLRKWEYISLQLGRDSIGLDYDFIIVELPSYDKLFSYVIESSAGMIRKQGYDLLIGLRDLYPNDRSDKDIIIRFNDKMLAGNSERGKITLILAVMETEAWFLCDHSVFERIEHKLTSDKIKSELKIDLVNDDPELTLEKPAETINRILQLSGSGMGYKKKQEEVDNVVNNIDFNYLFSCTGKIDSFFRFLRELDSRCLPA